jgi:hypothetical protein
MDVLLDALGYQTRQPHQEDVSTSSTDAHKELLEGVAALAQATTISLLSDHHPMLSRPAELALTLAGIVARTALAEPATS